MLALKVLGFAGRYEPSAVRQQPRRGVHLRRLRARERAEAWRRHPVPRVWVQDSVQEADQARCAV